LRLSRLLLDVHLVFVQLAAAMVDVFVFVLRLGLGLRALRGGNAVCVGWAVVVVEIDHLVAVLQAVVGLRSDERLLLRGADGIGFEMLQRIRGQVVEVRVGEVELVLIHFYVLLLLFLLHSPDSRLSLPVHSQLRRTVTVCQCTVQCKGPMWGASRCLAGRRFHMRLRLRLARSPMLALRPR
jgi:hypothetical protein